MTNNTAFELPITPQIQVSGWAGDRATPGGGPELPVFYPATGQKISVVIEDDEASVDKAVTTARQAFDKGPGQVFLTRRGSCLERCGEVIRENADELARLECAATGLILRELKERHMVRAAHNFRFLQTI